MAHRTKLQAVRHELGYSAAATITLLTRQAQANQIPIMTAVSLKTKLSRWENGHEAVGLPEYRRLFRQIYGRTNVELGFPDDHTPGPADNLRARIAAARTVDLATVETFRAQIEHTRRVDRQFGGLTQLDQLRHHIDHVEGLLAYGPAAGHRAALAAALVEASTLAGWQALDRDDHDQAWQHYERAKHAAREAGTPLLLAHATAEQAFILTALDELMRPRRPYRQACSFEGPGVASRDPGTAPDAALKQHPLAACHPREAVVMSAVVMSAGTTYHDDRSDHFATTADTSRNNADHRPSGHASRAGNASAARALHGRTPPAHVCSGGYAVAAVRRPWFLPGRGRPIERWPTWHQTFNAVHGALRCLGERANSLLKTTYKALRRYRGDP